MLAPGELRGRDLGAISRLSRTDYYSNRFERTVVPVDSTTPVEYLQYRAEWTCFVRIGERVVNAENCHTSAREMFLLEREPVIRWWIRISGSEDGAGWLLVTDRAAREVARRF